MVERYCFQIQDMIEYFFHIDFVDGKYLWNRIYRNFIFSYPRDIKSQTLYLIQFFVDIRDVRDLDDDRLEEDFRRRRF